MLVSSRKASDALATRENGRSAARDMDQGMITRRAVIIVFIVRLTLGSAAAPTKPTPEGRSAEPQVRLLNEKILLCFPFCWIVIRYNVHDNRFIQPHVV